VDGSCIRKEKVAESKISGYVWTGPFSLHHLLDKHVDHFGKFRDLVAMFEGKNPYRDA